MVDRAFAKVLRESRQAAGLTQEALAELSDLDRSYISEIERCLKVPSLTTLWRLARALNLPLHEMMARVEAELGEH